MKAGILALQGDFEAHQIRLRELGVDACLIKNRAQLAGIDVLLLPGGESSAMLKLMDADLTQSLVEWGKTGKPILATCAGVILIAKNVLNPGQRSLDLIDIDVVRNAYGRQVDSFARELHWTKAAAVGRTSAAFEGVFIRAPKISRVGTDVEVLIECNGDPVLVRSGRIFAATFHPELGSNTADIYKMFFEVENLH